MGTDTTGGCTGRGGVADGLPEAVRQVPLRAYCRLEMPRDFAVAVRKRAAGPRAWGPEGGGGGDRNRAPGPHAHRTTARQAMDGLWTEVRGQQNQSNDPGNNQHNPQYANYWAPLTRKRYTPRHIQHSPGTPTTGLCERGNDTRRSTGRSGRQNAATRRNMRRDERVTVQGPVKEQHNPTECHTGGGPHFQWLASQPPPPAACILSVHSPESTEGDAGQWQRGQWGASVIVFGLLFEGACVGARAVLKNPFLSVKDSP